MNAEGCCYFVGVNVGVNVGVKCRRKYCFGGNSGGNADVNVGENVGNMSERKIIENQYVIVLWGVGYRQ